MKKTTLLLLLPAIAVVALDQISKYIIASTITKYGSFTVIEGFFNLVHVRNLGLAFGLMNRPGDTYKYYIFVAATICAIGLLLLWFKKMKDEDPKITLGLSLILGGAVGNFIDRIRLGEVIDFLDFHIGAYHWPAFNVADSAITIGILWLALIILWGNTSKGQKG